jgi:hypothetical protein
MDRCPVTGSLRLNGKNYFNLWRISRSWPEELCTYETCTLICNWIEQHYVNGPPPGMTDDEAARFMIEQACTDLYERDIISLS